MVKWISEYVRKGEPRVWYYGDRDRSSLRLIVHQHIHLPLGVWAVSARGIGLEAHNLHEVDLEKAKIKAIDLVRSRLVKMLDELGEVEQ